MTLLDPVRLAVVGSGNIASLHTQAIASTPLAQLTAVCARNRTKAKTMVENSSIPIYATIEELIASVDVDGILVATPSGIHHEAVITALRAGKHVLCEKPLEISTDRVARMIREAEISDRILAGFLPMRYGAGARAIRTALDKNRFGRLTAIGARIKWWRDQPYYSASQWRGTWDLDGGGALMNQGIHAVDLISWFGGPAEKAFGFASNLAHPGIEVEDTLTAVIQFESGCMGSISAATSCYPGLDLAIEVSGDKGTAILINDRIEFWEFCHPEETDQMIRDSAASSIIKGGSSDPKAISSAGHQHQIEEFCQAIRGEQITLIEGREAGRAVAIVEAIYRSTRSLKAETITNL